MLIKKIFVLISGSLLLSGVSFSQKKLQPDSLYVLSFAALPETMFHQIIDTTDKTKMSFYLPANYSKKRKFPLLLWINGATGGPGTDIDYARKLVHLSLIHI